MTTPQEPSEENGWDGYVPRHQFRQQTPIDHGPQVHRVGDLLPTAALRPATWSFVNRYQTTRRIPQLYNNNCVGMAAAYIIEALLLARGDSNDPSAHLSVIMPWNGAKAAENDLGQNVGVYPHDALTYTRNIGICTAALLPQTDTADDYAAVPSTEALANAQTRLGITFAQAASFDEMVTAAAALDTPPSSGIAVYPAFENPTRDGRCSNGALFTGTRLGYHDIALVAYNESSQNQDAWTYTYQNWWEGYTNDDQWVLTRPQALQTFSEGWTIQLWPQRQPEVQHFVPQGSVAPLWNYILQNGIDSSTMQTLLDNGWGKFLRTKGCA